ncbi:MAG: alanine racemase [Verrucomicrobiota bacterium]|jgi:alanine racemase
MKPTDRRPRSAWVEVDLVQLAHNWALIRREVPPPVSLMFVTKDNAYGLGAVEAARVALATAADSLAVFTLGEAQELRDAGITAPILLLGERLTDEVPHVLELDLEPCVGSVEMAQAFARAGQERRRPVPVHLKVNTGMNRFGLSWRTVESWAPFVRDLPGLEFRGALSHFAQSDELDKGFARTQSGRFEQVMAHLAEHGIRPRWIHHCNSGGVLDLPDAHFNRVRVGLLAQGVYPSEVCRRIEGISPVLSLKARLTTIQELEPGDTVGYGMRWRAEHPCRIGVLSVGYGDGYPRLRNQGHALLHGRRVPLVGGVTMDALMIDLSPVPEARIGDEAVLLGTQGGECITVQELARLSQTVTYDVLAGLRGRLPRHFVNAIS